MSDNPKKVEKRLKEMMSFNDFGSAFEKVQFCYLGPEVMDEVHSLTNKIVLEGWTDVCFDGKWVAGVTAGGKATNANIVNFAKNPQYWIQLDSAHGRNNRQNTVIISVLQKYRVEMEGAYHPIATFPPAAEVDAGGGGLPAQLSHSSSSMTTYRSASRKLEFEDI
ncbi:hypothetical protein GPALN_006071 [Globodera pallida]|nr:hypothetical protein GPALN_006071 [Globodera pallida]